MILIKMTERVGVHQRAPRERGAGLATCQAASADRLCGLGDICIGVDHDATSSHESVFINRILATSTRPMLLSGEE